MSRGRKPIPSAVKKLLGDGKRDSGGRLIIESVTAPLGRPCPPSSIRSPEALAEWEAITDDLEALGVLATTDRAMLHLYIEQWEVKRMAYAQLNADNLVGSAGHGNIGANQHLKIFNEASAFIVKALVEFGLTPSAREKIKAKPISDDSPELNLS